MTRDKLKKATKLNEDIEKLEKLRKIVGSGPHIILGVDEFDGLSNVVRSIELMPETENALLGCLEKFALEYVDKLASEFNSL